MKIASISGNNGSAIMVPPRVLDGDLLSNAKPPEPEREQLEILNREIAPVKITSVLREISFLLATAGSLLASGTSLILSPKNPIRKSLEFFATQSVNLSLGWVAGITGVIDQIKNKDLPMIGIQIGDSLATLFSDLENKTMNRGVWIGLMNIFNFVKKHIPEKKNFADFGESIQWSIEGLKRYLSSIQKQGFINALQDRKGSAFGITTSMFTILGSLIYLVTGSKCLAPILRHFGGAISESDKFNSDNHQNGRFKLINAGTSMLLSSIVDVLAQIASKSKLEKPFAFLNQALNNYGRFFQLESQQVNELGNSYPSMSFTQALIAGAKDFLNLNNLTADIKKVTNTRIRNLDQSEVARTVQSKLLAV